MINSVSIVIVIPGCGGGDWPPLLALAKGLHRNGYNLVAVCDSETEEAVTGAGIRSLCLPRELALAHFFEPALSLLLKENRLAVAGSVNPFSKWGESCIEFITSSFGELQPSLILSSLFGVGLGELLAKRFSAKWCFLNPSFSFGASGKGQWGTDFSKAGGEMYQEWLLPLVQSADLILHATVRFFDVIVEDDRANHEYIGPLFWEIEQHQQKYFKNQGPPWVLITLSTSPQPDDLVLVQTALKSLEKVKVRILVTLAPEHDISQIVNVSENVCITRYIPHSQVLPDCCLVISHAGHGIVMKAMAYGVPMVLVPWGRDQPGVALRAERLGVAEVVSKQECSVSNLSAGIRKILSDSEYRKNAGNVAEHLNALDSVASGCEQIRRLLAGS